MRLYLSLVALLSLAATSSLLAETPKTIGEVIRMDPALDQLLPRDAKIEVLADGFEWSEGPVWDGKRERLLFSDIPNNRINQWKPGGGISVFMPNSGYTGKEPFTGPEPGTNGLAFDSEGRLVMCCHGDRAIKRVEKDGSVTVLAASFQGKRLNSPNDLVFHKNGDLYFTDPPYGLPKRFADPARELAYCGVYRLTPTGELSLVTKEMTRPNGISFSPDFGTLYLAQSDPKAAIWKSFQVQADGSLSKGKLFYDVNEFVGKRPGGCDGMAVDTKGNLWATGPGGVYVFTPKGKLLGRLSTGERTANCCFGGPEGKTLFITADMYLCRVETLVVGTVK